MVVSCAAYNCTNRWTKGCSRTFYRFPITNEALVRKWIKAIRRQSFTPTRYHHICSDHFEEECFLQNYVNVRKLKDDAVPTIFNFPDHQDRQLKPTVKPPLASKRRVFTNPLANDKSETLPNNNYSVEANFQDHVLEPSVKTRPAPRVLPRPKQDTESETLPANNNSSTTYFPDHLLELTMKTGPAPEMKVSSSPLEDTGSETLGESSDSDGTSMVEIVDQHSYSISPSPSKLQRKLNSIIERKDKSLSKYRMNLSTCQKKCRRQAQKIAKLKGVISELKTKKLIDEKAASVLESCF